MLYKYAAKDAQWECCDGTLQTQHAMLQTEHAGDGVLRGRF